ncbi:HAD-IB family hydrolase [Criblamydia sequanensis]|uniref:HAD-superfamily hydrolase n=1 Tax=Candidatus Criblamydia sequanensis CRIB-18 TaxID=1437425 RepID=A0A090E0N9_9BACT|nr:HAD-IB family hydrolase [Criblamydia sequanensis]CDR34374.1 HAD-superfamily hydrolase [Criblamydia sequanensis CRIB-18]
MNPKETIAAFDFDGTITTRDSLLPLLFFSNNISVTLLKLSLLAPYFLLFVLGLYSRQKTKEKILTSFFKGKTKEEMQLLGESYARSKLPSLVKKEALEKISWHASQGHRLFIVSASIDCYLTPWAKEKGFEGVISSKLDYDEQGRVKGTLLGQNCWGEEKVKKLFNAIQQDPSSVILYAYGDSKGDQALLNKANYSYYKKFN